MFTHLASCSSSLLSPLGVQFGAEVVWNIFRWTQRGLYVLTANTMAWTKTCFNDWGLSSRPPSYLKKHAVYGQQGHLSFLIWKENWEIKKGFNVFWKSHTNAGSLQNCHQWVQCCRSNGTARVETFHLQNHAIILQTLWSVIWHLVELRKQSTSF